MKLHKTHCCRYFTLLEIMVVISIIMLMSGLVFAYMGHMPAGLVLSSATGKVEQLMMSAQMQASLQGTQKDVVFDFEKKILFITAPSEDPQELEAPDTEEEAVDESQLKGNSYKIPESIEVTFPDFSENIPVFSFFSDGSAAGPEMNLTIKGHIMVVTVSQLTGIVMTKEIEE